MKTWKRFDYDTAKETVVSSKEMRKELARAIDTGAEVRWHAEIRTIFRGKPKQPNIEFYE